MVVKKYGSRKILVEFHRSHFGVRPRSLNLKIQKVSGSQRKNASLTKSQIYRSPSLYLAAGTSNKDLWDKAFCHDRTGFTAHVMAERLIPEVLAVRSCCWIREMRTLGMKLNRFIRSHLWTVIGKFQSLLFVSFFTVCWLS